MIDAYWRDLLVDISDNPTNGASVPYALGAPADPIVPTAILSPSNLQNVDRVKFQISYDGTTFYDIVDEDGLVITQALVVSTMMPVLDAVQVAMLGVPYMRLVTTDGAGTAEEPAGDITFRVHFAEATV